MDRREYCRQLTQELRHLTAKEVAAVRQEFMDHMEDHAEMLRACAVDLFPRTANIESVCLLERKD